MKKLISKSIAMPRSTTTMPRFKVINILDLFGHVMQA
jgi:hypothetical protein